MRVAAPGPAWAQHAAMTTDEIDALARSFRGTAEEYAGSSPLYERLAYGVADRPDLLSPLLAAGPTQRRSLLYFAAVSYLLRTVAAGHPLADWYPVLGGAKAAHEGDPVTALADLVDDHREALTRACAERITQTNEANRAALVRPALGRAAELTGGRPLALIELGCSGGVLLAIDRYEIAYRLGEHTRVVGSGGLRIECELRGDGWPDAAGTQVRLSRRTGIDLHPVAPGDTDGAAWLRSCVWPEHVAREARLTAALAEVAATAPTMVTADMRTGLDTALAAVPADAVPCVLTSHALLYLDATDRDEMIRRFDEVGAARDLVVITNEPAEMPLFGPALARLEPAARVATHVTVASWPGSGGAASVEVLAEGDAHGSWLHYRPRRYDRRTASLVA